MSINRTELKERAKDYLKNPFLSVSMGAIGIYLAISVFGGFVPIVGSFAGIFAFIYNINITRMHYEMEIFNCAPPIKRTFDFTGIFRIVCGRLWAILKVWPAYLLMYGGLFAILIGFIVGLFAGATGDYDNSVVFGGMFGTIAIGYIALIAGAILLVILNLNYVLTEYILMDNPNMKAIDGTRLSKQMMKGHKGEWFVMMLSFIGWDILTTLTFGVLSIYVTPYKLHTSIGYYNVIKSNFVQVQG